LSYKIRESDKDFVELALWFAENADGLDEGVYGKGDIEFIVKPSIPTGKGETPARIHKQFKFIEVSAAQFKELTVYERMVILAHEYAHGFKNSDIDDEFEADRNGNRIYLMLGFPKTEVMYTYACVFDDTPVNRERAYEADKQLRNALRL